MKEKVIAALLAAMCVGMAPAAVYGQDGSQKTETASEEEAGLSGSLYDFQVKIDSVVYQLPMSYADFTAQGWELSDSSDADLLVGTSSYGSISFHKDADSVYADVINLGINENPVSQCLIGGISIDGTYDMDPGSTTVELPGGILLGKATLDDVKAAYGEPSDTYESELYTKLTYSKDSYEEIELYVYTDNGTLKKVDMRNFVEPEGFDKGTVSEEIPQIVTDYAAPTALGEDILDTTVEYCGDLYTLPVPVSAFTANGWELLDVDADAYVAGDDMDVVEMMKNNQTVRFYIYNMTGNATGVENCFVQELEVASYDSEALTLKLSGGFTLGAGKDALMEEAKAKGYLYEEDGDYLNIYRDEDTRISNRAQFWFGNEEKPDAASAVIYRNDILPEGSGN